eukprot:CAMPEP_0115367700 /NCGR_PEP_ID=MMETSP0270-20121206/105446_1 /TAXON_ID=71861 /ORGANISM="Scrippsiella trochoidea, Strain CCMP3099" /LENGTH=107 /DNA_ID=CAMNT_0002790491 /DNA_START=107 /DNA_END=429 /DNA_ORIENTATION=-
MTSKEASTASSADSSSTRTGANLLLVASNFGSCQTSFTETTRAGVSPGLNLMESAFSSANLAASMLISHLGPMVFILPMSTLTWSMQPVCDCVPIALVHTVLCEAAK